MRVNFSVATREVVVRQLNFHATYGRKTRGNESFVSRPIHQLTAHGILTRCGEQIFVTVARNSMRAEAESFSTQMRHIASLDACSHARLRI